MAAPLVKVIVATEGGKLVKHAALALLSLIVAVLVIVVGGLTALTGLVFGLTGASANEAGGGCFYRLPAGQSITITRESGDWTLSADQIETAAGLAAGALQVGATDRELALVLGAAMQESSLRILANEMLPESLQAHHHATATPTTADGSPVDTLGPLQQRPSAGWGSIAQLMRVEYAATAFIGGTTGPNGGSPRGLRDIEGLGAMGFADAIEAVQISGEPEHYGKWEADATRLAAELKRLGDLSCAAGGGLASVVGQPVDPAASCVTSWYGHRTHPISGEWRLHTGIDFVSPGLGDPPLYAIADGTIVTRGFVPGWGNVVEIDLGDGHTVWYAHLVDGLPHSPPIGTPVKAGDRIGTMGTTGPSTGVHLHIELRQDGRAVDITPALGGVEGLQATYSGCGNIAWPNT